MSLREQLPSEIKSILRYLYYFPIDTLDFLLGRRDELTPPRRMNLAGDGDFKEKGREFFKYFVELGGLSPGDIILDAGCGIGRMAVPLTGYLTTGRYEGFDIIAKEIEWCMEKIGTKHPNFHFQCADVYNKSYNPDGRFKASEYKFPYADESFTFLFMTSVFTHMIPEEMENYFSEIARVLKKKGRCLVTFFLLNRESSDLIEQRKSHLDFRFEGKGFRTISETKPEEAIAFDEVYVRNLFTKNGFELSTPIQYGSWCGRAVFLSFQDIVIAVKR